MAAPSHEEDLALLIKAAREAGAIAMGFFRRDPQVWWKEGNSPVSEADFAVDTFLKETLIGARPDYGWLSEETEPREGEHSRFFVVDPIDGTRSFLRGETTWCVSIAVVEAGRPVAGVIDAPALEEVFTAHSSGPALLNGQPMGVSAPVTDGSLLLSAPDSIRKEISASEQETLRFAPNTPSLALRLALVAAGRLDGTLIRPRANDWDIAAGDLILERSGGALSDVELKPRHYRTQGMRHGILLAGAGHAIGRLRRLASGIRSV